MRRFQRSVGRIKADRVEKHTMAITEHLIAPVKTIIRPPSATSGTAEIDPIHQHEAGTGSQMEFLLLPVSGTAERLHWIRREHEKRFRLQHRGGNVPARQRSRVPINL